MKAWHRPLVALGLLAPACSSAPAPTAHRGSTTVAPLHPLTPADEATTTTEPATTTTTRPLAGAVVTIDGLPAPTRRGTTSTTFTVPEVVEEPDEFDARDAATARVSWYGDESGTHTANGDRWDPSGLTFAHLRMPFGTKVKFCGPLGCVVARCTDRGPAAWTGKTFDLSEAAFARVAPLSAGVATVTWEVVG